jgi:hypothetical protein
MPYRLRYDVSVDYVVAGIGLGHAAVLEAATPGNAGASLTFYFGQAADPASNTFTSADVANLLSTMVADITAQMTVPATLAKIQNAGTVSAVPPPGGN